MAAKIRLKNDRRRSFFYRIIVVISVSETVDLSRIVVPMILPALILPLSRSTRAKRKGYRTVLSLPSRLLFLSRLQESRNKF